MPGFVRYFYKDSVILSHTKPAFKEHSILTVQSTIAKKSINFHEKNCQINLKYTSLLIGKLIPPNGVRVVKGAWGPRSIVTFLLFLIVDNGSYQEHFFGMKKYCSQILSKVIEFSNCENTSNYTVDANLNRDFPKINFKIYLLLQFLRYWI